MVDVALAVGVFLVKHSSRVVVAEDVHKTATIPVVRHTASVVDLARGVLQHLKNKQSHECQCLEYSYLFIHLLKA